MLPKLPCVTCFSSAVQASALQSADDISDALAGAEVVMVVVSPCLSRWLNKLTSMLNWTQVAQPSGGCYFHSVLLPLIV